MFSKEITRRSFISKSGQLAGGLLFGGTERESKSGDSLYLFVPVEWRTQGKNPNVEVYRQIDIPFRILNKESVFKGERWQVQPLASPPLGFNATLVGTVSVREYSKGINNVRLHYIKIGEGSFTSGNIGFNCVSDLRLFLPVFEGKEVVSATPEEFMGQLVGGRRICEVKTNQWGFVTAIEQTHAIEIRRGDTLNELAVETGKKRELLEKWNLIINPDKIYAGDVLYTSLSLPTVTKQSSELPR